MTRLCVILICAAALMSCNSPEPPEPEIAPKMTQEEAIRFEREFMALVEKQRNAQKQPEQTAQQPINNNEEEEIARARREIDALERDAHKRNLEYDREIKKRQLAEWQAYKDDLDRQIAENNERERKARVELERLRQMQVDAEKSGQEMIDRIRKSVQ